MKITRIISVLLAIACIFALTSCSGNDGKPSKRLALELSAEGDSYTGVGMGKCKDKEIVIPREYKGLPVTAIGEYAFSGSDITKITVTENIVSIAENAFENCSSLVYNMHEGICYIGSAENPYYALISVKENSDESFTLHKDVKILADCSLYDCDVVSLTIPEGVTHIGNGALYSCGELESISLPETVVIIGNEAFGNCGVLTEITIPASTKKLGDSVFMYCTKLATVHFAGTKAQWDVVDNSSWDRYFSGYTLICSDTE